MVVDAAMQSGITVGGMVEGTRVGHCESLWRQEVGGEKGSGLSEGLCEPLLWTVSHATITGIPEPPPLKSPQHSCPEARAFRVFQSTESCRTDSNSIQTQAPAASKFP